MARKHPKSPLIGLALAGLTALPVAASPDTRNSPGGWFQKLDQNADGAITLREFLQKRGQQFASLDADHNGAVSIREYETAQTSIRRFLDLDHNGDSEVRLGEYLRPARTRFRQLDGNDDGRITEAEIENFRQRMRAKHEQRKRLAAQRPASAFRLTRLAGLNDK